MQNNNQEAKVLACIAQPFTTNALLLIKDHHQQERYLLLHITFLGFVTTLKRGWKWIPYWAVGCTIIR